MPKGKYRRRKKLGRKRKRNNKWREKKKAKERSKDVSALSKEQEHQESSVSSPGNPAPAKRTRFDHRIHARSSSMCVALNEKERRMQIFWYWRDTLGSPPPSQWTGTDGIISVIVRELKLSQGSRGTVAKVLQNAWLLHTKGKIYDGRSARVGKPSNNPRAIQPGSLDEQIIADCYEDGFSLARTAEKVYRARKALDPDNARTVGISAVAAAIHRLKPVVTGINLFIYLFII